MFAQEILSEIDLTIDKLILNTKEMTNNSHVNITKEEINSFQNIQELLIAHLIQMDNTYKIKKDELKKPHLDSASLKISKKLRQFEDLNNEFIRNTTRKFNIIHFEERKVKKIRTRKKRSFTKAKLNKN